MTCCNSSAGRTANAARYLAGWLVILSLGSAIPVRADYRDDYRQALEAIERLEWSEAQSLLLRAIREKPEPGQFNMFQRLDFTPYLPYYYLGLVLYEQGDCEGALLQWTISEEKGRVRGPRESAMRRMTRTCNERLAEEAARAESAPPPPLSATATLNDGAGPDDLPAVPPGGTTTPSVEAAPPSGSNPGSTEPGRGAPSRRPLAGSSGPGISPRTSDRTTTPLARQRLENLRTRVQRLVRDVQATLDGSADLELPAEAANRRQALESELTRLRELARQRPVAFRSTEQAADRVSSLHAGYQAALNILARPARGSADSTPPTALILAADAYLRADYQRVLDDLTPLLTSGELDTKSLSTAQLLCAAAAYSLYLENGGEDPTFLTRAQEARTASRDLSSADGAAARGERRLALFSPPVRAFLTAELQP